MVLQNLFQNEKKVRLAHVKAMSCAQHCLQWRNGNQKKANVHKQGTYMLTLGSNLVSLPRNNASQ